MISHTCHAHNICLKFNRGIIQKIKKLDRGIHQKIKKVGYQIGWFFFYFTVMLQKKNLHFLSQTRFTTCKKHNYFDEKVGERPSSFFFFLFFLCKDWMVLKECS